MTDTKIRHVISVSGGKDSDATLKIALNRCAPGTVIPIFCDTDNEDRRVYEHLDYLERTLGVKITRLKADFSDEFARKRMFIARDQRVGRKYDTAPVVDAIGNPVPKRDARGNVVTQTVRRAGQRVTEPVQKTKKVGGGKRVRWTNKAKRRALAELRPTGIAMLDLCMLKGRFPSRKAQFCTERLKRDVAVMFQLDLVDAGYRVISWQGIRRDESHARRNAKLYERIGPRMWAFRPLVERSAMDVFAFLAAEGVRPNDLYYMNMTRVGCMPCINASKEEVREISQRLPEHIERVSEWERKVSACSKWGFTTFFHKVERGAAVCPAAEFSRSKIEKIVEWSRTTRGGKQFDLLAVEPASLDACASAYGLCE